MALKDILKSPTAAELRNRLAQAERENATLEGQHGSLALAAESGDNSAASQLTRLQDAMTSGQRRLIALRAAIHAVELAEAKAAAEAQAAARASLVNSIKHRIGQRDKAAIRLAAAVENLCSAFVELQEINAAISAAIPSGTPLLPTEGLREFYQLKDAVAAELMRAGHGRRSANGTTFPFAVPGAKFEDMRQSSDPDAIEPFESKVKGAGRYVVGVLSGDITPEYVAQKMPKPPEEKPNDVEELTGIDPRTVEAATLASGQRINAQNYVLPAPVKMG